MQQDQKILGVKVSNLSLEEVLEYLFKNLEKKEKKLFLTTINSEILVSANKNSDIKNLLNSSDLALVDGVWAKRGGQLLGIHLKQRIAGTDLVEIICKEVSIRPITVGFLGGKHNVAEMASERLKNKYPGLKIAFAIENWPQNQKEQNSLKCDILFVALGHPKQEKWIAQNLPKINVWMAMGVGGAFDILSGKVRRAPKIVQNLGFEWLFRLMRQPWRVRRQVNLIYFVLLILKEKLKVSFGKK